MYQTHLSSPSTWENMAALVTQFTTGFKVKQSESSLNGGKLSIYTVKHKQSTHTPHHTKTLTHICTSTQALPNMTGKQTQSLVSGLIMFSSIVNV